MSEMPGTPEKLSAGKPPLCRRSSSGSPNSTLQLPSPIITKRTRTASTSARAMENPLVTGIVKSFSRTKGHGFIIPNDGSEELFCHISDIEGEYVPMEGDEVKYRLCAIPPKNEKFQAVHVKIINLTPEVHHSMRRRQNSKEFLAERQADDEGDHGRPDIRGDRANIAILLFLYILQGIPIGLIAAIPMMLQNRGASYKQQAEFSFAFWPFSMKLLWAPIVDSCYVKRFGRRKSWMVPCQYLLGVFMLFLSWQVDGWLGGEGMDPNVPLLTTMFFMLNFLAATQDIAVDGWALTMLKRCNVGYASTCNSVGQTAGYFLGYVAFIALESKDFCNTYLRSLPKEVGMITLPEFLWFWGWCFMVATTLVAIFKRENEPKHKDDGSRYTEEHEMNVYESYKILWDMVRMRPVQILAGILLTVKVTFAACDAVTSLKLIDAGVPKEKLALLAVPIIPLQIVLPLIVSRYTNGPRPMEVYVKAIPYRIVFASIAAVIAYFTPYLIQGGEVPIYYYVLLIINYGIYQIFLYCMFVAVMAFFAKISDPAVGGTYMTFLNTLSNLGGNWANTVILWLVDVLTWKECLHAEEGQQLDNRCLTKTQTQECTASGGKCEIVFDGYYIEAIVCVIYGIVWLMFMRKWINYLQNLPTKSWLVVKTPKSLAHKMR